MCSDETHADHPISPDPRVLHDFEPRVSFDLDRRAHV